MTTNTLPKPAMPSPAEFLALPSIEEDDLEPEVPPASNALDSIAASLRALVAVAQGQEQAGSAENELRGEVLGLQADRERLIAKLAETRGLVDKVLAICKPSTSKLANSVREAVARSREHEMTESTTGSAADTQLEQTADDSGPRIVAHAVQCPACSYYFADQALLKAHACTAEGADGVPSVVAPPADDADVEAWRAYARDNYSLPEDTVVDTMNRSQIRSLLGMPHPNAE